MQSIKGIDVTGKRVIVRVDYNVPITDGKIDDDTKILASLKTINYLLDKKAKIILLSHLGRIKSQADKESHSLEIVAKHLSTLVSCGIYFIPFTRGEIVNKTIENMNNGEIVILENTRFEDYPKSLESSCDEALSKYWASLGDIFVLDAFGSAHRCHASTYGISKYLPSYSGFLVDNEVSMLDKAIHQRKTLILGGAKVDDKIGVIDNLINTSDNILLGGAMCFTFLKASGVNVGESIVSDDKIRYAKSLLDTHGNKIILPIDVVTNDGVKDVTNIGNSGIGYDIGPKTINKYKELLINSKLILWNGPLGMFEDPKYEDGTKKVMQFIYNQSIPTILAGGDIISASHKFKYNFTYLSTGGGATLEYLEGKRFKTLERLNGSK
ncbi:phosphoglycerate kinase [Clostridium sp. CAG:524]|jgi:phosphoglycerate kinase|nr:phosphoglycerate kinase [Clostridium sp. CAG:524]